MVQPGDGTARSGASDAQTGEVMTVNGAANAAMRAMLATAAMSAMIVPPLLAEGRLARSAGGSGPGRALLAGAGRYDRRTTPAHATARKAATTSTPDTRSASPRVFTRMDAVIA